MTRRFLNPTFLFVSLDFTLAVGAFCLAFLLRFQMDMTAAVQYVGPLAPRAATFAATVMLGLLAMGLYRARQRPRPWEACVRVMIGVGIGALLSIFVFYLFPYLNSGRGVLGGALAISSVTLSAGRMALLPFIDRNPTKKRILVLGVGSTALTIAQLRRASDRRGFEIAGYVALKEADLSAAKQLKQLQPLISSEQAVEYMNIDEVVVALDERRGTLPTDMLLQIKSRGIPITDVISFLERETAKLHLNLLSPSWFVYTDAGYTDALYRGVKRLADIALSALIFALTAPIYATVIIMIWIEDGLRAPILYRQKRIGLGGQPFELFKFRSMETDAEADTGPQWSLENDARITHVGRLIRRFRIDELPQLFNIFRGDMSIVGPRPERPKFVDLLTAEEPMFSIRHTMRPGLTGWAQLNFPYGASVRDAREKLSYDLYYIKNAGLLLDLLIFLQTIEVVVWGKAISMAGPVRSSDHDAHGARGSVAPAHKPTPAASVKN